jgi:hypothetical protein
MIETNEARLLPPQHHFLESTQKRSLVPSEDDPTSRDATTPMVGKDNGTYKTLSK